MPKEIEAVEREERIIFKVQQSGKWIEFWWEDGKHNPESFDACSKSCIFEVAIANAGLNHHVLNNGVKGLRVIWEDDGFNLEIVEVRKH